MIAKCKMRPLKAKSRLGGVGRNAGAGAPQFEATCSNCKNVWITRRPQQPKKCAHCQAKFEAAA